MGKTEKMQIVNSPNYVSFPHDKCTLRVYTSIGLLTADKAVNPSMSEKYTVTLSNVSAKTGWFDISCRATDLFKDTGKAWRKSLELSPT